MPDISAADASAQIAAIIADSLDAADELKAALLRERRALEDQDTDALYLVVDSKNSCSQKLQRLEQTRRQLCGEWGFPDTPNQMQDLLDWCDGDGRLSRDWANLLHIAAEGNALNLTNGAIIRVRQQHMESSLSVLRGVSPGSATYGQNGTESGDASRRSLAEA